MVIVYCTSPHCHLSVNQVSFQSLLYFPRYGSDRHSLWKNKWLSGDNSVNTQGRIMVLVHCPSSYCHLSVNQVPLHLFYTFQDTALTGNNYEKWLWGDNSINIQGRIMVHGYCPSPHCHLSIYQVPLQSLLYFPRYGPDRQHLWKMVKGR